jgi:hypothetical protein
MAPAAIGNQVGQAFFATEQLAVALKALLGLGQLLLVERSQVRAGIEDLLFEAAQPFVHQGLKSGNFAARLQTDQGLCLHSLGEAKRQAKG